MASIHLENVTVDIPVYTASARSLRRAALNVGVGGLIRTDSRDHVTVRALDGVSLSFKDGARVGLIGHNGAGKSTLLRIMAGLREPTEGWVSLDGSISSLLSLTSLLDGEMTGHENIEHVGALTGIPPSRCGDLLQDVAEFSGLGGFLELPVRTYSAGMLLRLSFALMTAHEPEILLLDETIVVGDGDFLQRAEKRMARMQEKSRIVVLASHSMQYLTQMSNVLVWLEKGKVRDIGAPDKILAAYVHSLGHAGLTEAAIS